MLTVKQVAERLQCSAATIYELCSLKKIRHARIGKGRAIRIREEDLEAYLTGRAVGPEPLPPVPAKLRHLRI
jgi:excisionase family DNA binding protein